MLGARGLSLTQSPARCCINAGIPYHNRLVSASGYSFKGKARPCHQIVSKGSGAWALLQKQVGNAPKPGTVQFVVDYML